MGEILSIKGSSQSKKVKIKAKKVLENVKIGDSISTNGVCLNVTSF